MIELWLLKLDNKALAIIYDLNRKTVSKISKNLSKYLVPNYYEKLEQISGNSTIVEIDESKVGKRKYNRGHAADRVWVLEMVERTEKRRIVLLAVDDRTKATLVEKLLLKLKKAALYLPIVGKGILDSIQ